MMRKNSCITDQIQEERQVSFMCHIRESESKTFHFHLKGHQDLIKTWSFCYCVRFNKMSQTFI